MRRAIIFLTLVVCVTTLCDVPASRAKGRPTINGIGLINYAAANPTFKPGDWVRYRVSGANNEGAEDDYYVTVFIAGEEHFWGEDCFWVETRTQPVGPGANTSVATLISYSIFGNSLAIARPKLFMRKTITDVSEDGTPRQDLTKRPPLTLRNRKPPSEHPDWSVDTVGVDTVNTPRGLFTCTKVRREEATAATADHGDSSSNTEVRDARMIYYADGIPITGIAREHILNTIRRKSWLIGRSSDAEMKLVAIAEGNARLVDFGSGLTSLLVPKHLQRTLSEQRATKPGSAPARPKAKRTG